MKLKLIKDSEVVVSKTEYELLKITNKHMQDLGRDVKYGEHTYFIDNSLYYPVVKVTNKVASFPIKMFKSDDHEYNRICAEELVELLNQ